MDITKNSPNTPSCIENLRSGLSRRDFAAVLGAAPLSAAPAQPRPNFLWITCEDMGPNLYTCGDDYSVTPNLDKLARRGQIYMNAWSNAPVCAPARTTIITGMYPPSTGSEHMRSLTRLPAGMKMFPQFLREAGYYCSNNAKEDYNLEKPEGTWDDSSKKGHWRNRTAGQPFFSVFNLEITHESQIRRRPHTWVHDPAKVRVPAYHPDTPEVRQDWAEYYDNITTMDSQAGKLLEDLEKDGLTDETIVFFYGDHGSGMPRSKRWPYNSGLNVSILVAIPRKLRHLWGGEYWHAAHSNRMIGFVDLAPTMLSLAGIQPAPYHQGQAFLGKYAAPERPYNYGFRGRMDERYDMVRSVRDKRYVYIRNYMPHKIYGQYIAYMFRTPTTSVWKKLYDEGKLKPPQTYFWEPKPPEELYDLDNDRDEVNNLAKSPEHEPILKRLRQAESEWTSSIRDVGFLPEDEIHARGKESSPYEAGHADDRYPMAKVISTAEMASSLDQGRTGELLKRLKDDDSAVRHWAAMGLLMRGAEGVKVGREQLRQALQDPSAYVRITAAEALGRYGADEDLGPLLKLLIGYADLEKNGLYVSMWALNSIGELAGKAKPLLPAIKTLPVDDKALPPRVRGYVKNLVAKLVADLSA